VSGDSTAEKTPALKVHTKSSLQSLFLVPQCLPELVFRPRLSRLLQCRYRAPQAIVN